MQKITLRVLCDVNNPLFGKDGAAHIFAPQKGASPQQVRLLDLGLRQLAFCSAQALGKDLSQTPGAGAAGGMGFALKAFCNAELVSGIDCILDAARFSERAQAADLIVTGEGKMDAQSLMGKAPFGVASRAGSTPVAAVVGVLDAEESAVQAGGITKVFETNDRHLPFAEVKATAKDALILSYSRYEIHVYPNKIAVFISIFKWFIGKIGSNDPFTGTSSVFIGFPRPTGTAGRKRKCQR